MYRVNAPENKLGRKNELKYPADTFSKVSLQLKMPFQE